GAGNDNPETFQYYYHSDHLGSASLITNLDGEVVQHVEYVPFGEVFIEERNNKWNTLYLFNAKELDEETGLYYYGARYYDSRTSVFLGVDPMWEKYPGISSYAYCLNNPVIFIDPDGNDPVPAAPRNFIGKPHYYLWRYNNFVARNPNATAPSYYLEYGLKYAKRFKYETNYKLTPNGQRWIGETMENLQNAMENELAKQNGTELELNSQAFKDFAFTSHVDAYWNKDGSTPLYTLNTADLFAIVLTPDFDDLTSKEETTQAAIIMDRLAEYWTKKPEVAIRRAKEFIINRGKIQKMIEKKADKEISDRINKLIDQLKTYLTNSTNQ
ncbi:MAG: hypothetical protein LBJ63_06680, partial [Prevotellaceae bacterium]|nr:hypothetical protein [Prevotellaceae bacterium]